MQKQKKFLSNGVLVADNLNRFTNSIMDATKRPKPVIVYSVRCVRKYGANAKKQTVKNRRKLNNGRNRKNKTLPKM